MKLEVMSQMLVGPETKQFLVDLTTQVDRMERCLTILDKGAKPKPLAKVAEESFMDKEPESEEEAPAPKKQTKKAAQSFMDVEEEHDTIDMTEMKKEKKAPKAKAIDIKLVDGACHVRAQLTSVEEVRGILRRPPFKVASLHDLKPEQYADVIEAMKLEERE